ncbi:hypothetical protein TNCV_1491651 [Trichonephila clavipes]|nr:hypothetical protein TNCV_1491651 [Trichonephila clavipes]
MCRTPLMFPFQPEMILRSVAGDLYSCHPLRPLTLTLSPNTYDYAWYGPEEKLADEEMTLSRVHIQLKLKVDFFITSLLMPLATIILNERSHRKSLWRSFFLRGQCRELIVGVVSVESQVRALGPMKNLRCRMAGLR